MMSCKSDSKTVIAFSKEIPCFFRFGFRLLGIPDDDHQNYNKLLRSYSKRNDQKTGSYPSVNELILLSEEDRTENGSFETIVCYGMHDDRWTKRACRMRFVGIEGQRLRSSHFDGLLIEPFGDDPENPRRHFVPVSEYRPGPVPRHAPQFFVQARIRCAIIQGFRINLVKDGDNGLRRSALIFRSVHGKY